MPTIPTAFGVRRAPQQPDWPLPEAAAVVRSALAARAGLVTEEECRHLTASLGQAGRGEAVVLQGGDCAERFADAAPSVVSAKTDQLLALAATIRHTSGLPTHPVGRLAGQYAKPRSSERERLADGRSIPVYRGDAVNSAAYRESARTADPARLLLAHDAAATVLDTVRRSWPDDPSQPRVWCSHEALLLDYEEPLIRAGRRGPYGSSGHFLWIGDRTRSPYGAHIRLAATLTNPIGVKLGPGVAPSEAAELSRRLNPHGEAGRLTFIVRLGAAHVDDLLPGLVSEVARRGAPVLWLCDPMHGNTVPGPGGRKTRLLRDIAHEVTAFVRILRRSGQYPGGLHLEMTPEDVDECVDDEREPAGDRWPRNYRSACDPRLNPEQARQIVHTFSKHL
ncbi:3-deoxy-7-phosphoheptulonate synthase [Streptomyces sp. NPDC050315]|uniref:3-deoxy-7-phosphoheptulonate synthase n=1 Tax=Streptomyces sp. NPDC050315 TaxID=3155039 RepID=UPI003420FE1C